MGTRHDPLELETAHMALSLHNNPGEVQLLKINASESLSGLWNVQVPLDCSHWTYRALVISSLIIDSGIFK